MFGPFPVVSGSLCVTHLSPCEGHLHRGAVRRDRQGLATIAFSRSVALNETLLQDTSPAFTSDRGNSFPEIAYWLHPVPNRRLKACIRSGALRLARGGRARGRASRKEEKLQAAGNVNIIKQNQRRDSL